MASVRPRGFGGKARASVNRQLRQVLRTLDLSDNVSCQKLHGTGNQTWLVGMGAGQIVVRLDGSETVGFVDRAKEHRHAAIASSEGFGPQILLSDPQDGVLVTRYVEGRRLDEGVRPLTAELMRRLVCQLARLQSCSGFGGLMDPWAKVKLYLDDAGIDDPSAAGAFGHLWSRVQSLEGVACLDNRTLVPCHVDLVPQNLIDTGECVFLVDWEYAALSSPLWDAAYFAVETGLDSEELALWRRQVTDVLDVDTADFLNWMAVAMSVSLAWCLARQRRDQSSGDDWRVEIDRRRSELAEFLGV
ncbi:MAG: hypothetical protein CMM46_08095 [Rhodospirillaceae bacterium]|nr:hypothetical protein [Rhodospirillaceae bacterium]